MRLLPIYCLKEVSDLCQSNMAAFYMAELNIIHPFREGNGRTTREFIRSLALKSGLIINWDSVTYDEILEASISSVHDITLLSLCIQKCILPLHLL